MGVPMGGAGFHPYKPLSPLHNLRGIALKLSQDFFLKNRLIVMRLARDLLVAELGSRIRTVDYYANQFDVSRGTIQKAMQFLVEQRCVTSDFRGHLGSYLTFKDDEKLWEYSGFGALSGAMPLPLAPLTAGLATGICDCMKAEDVAFNCVFVQGSRVRVKGLRQGKYDFIIASRLTEQAISNEYDDVQKVLDLPNCIYAGRYILLFANPSKSEIEDGMIIAVDPTSIDQMYLTELVCAGKDVTVHESTYLDTLYKVKSGEADVTVSRADAVADFKLVRQDTHVKKLVLPGCTDAEIDLFGTAVVLAMNDNYGLAALLQKILSPSVVAQTQKQVMAGLRISGYY